MSNQDGRLLNPLSRRSYEKIGDCERSALSISYDSWISLRASSPGRCGGGALPFSTPRPPPPFGSPETALLLAIGEFSHVIRK